MEKEDQLSLKQQFLLEERAPALASQKKFYESASLLQDIKYKVKQSDLGLYLLETECYIQLGRENKLTTAMKNIEAILTETDMNDLNAIVLLADEFTALKSCTRSIILMRFAADKVFQSNIPSEEKIEKLHLYITKMHRAIQKLMAVDKTSSKTSGSSVDQLQKLLSELLEPLKVVDTSKFLDMPDIAIKRSSEDVTRNRIIGLDFGVDYMIEMLEKMQLLEVSDSDKKAIRLAWICSHIGYNLAEAGDNSKSIKFRQRGISILNTQFQEHATDYRIYGVLLHNIGIVLLNSEKYAESEHYHKKAVQAKEQAIDYEDEKQKRDDVESTRNALKRLKAKLM